MPVFWAYGGVMTIIIKRGPHGSRLMAKRRMIAGGVCLLAASYAWAGTGDGIIPGVRDNPLTIALSPPIPMETNRPTDAPAPELTGPAPGLDGITYEALAAMQSGGTMPDGSAIIPPALTPGPGVFPIDPGPSAPNLAFLSRSSLDTLRASICLTTAIYYEAASESDDGQRGVAQVILNRARHPAYPKTVCGVVFQGTDRGDKLCQFSFACDGSMLRVPSAAGWARARRIAGEALAGRAFAPVGMATHYHTHAVNPVWNRSLAKAAIIGNHVFWRWGGNAGSPASFSQRYAGGEPFPAPKIAPAAQTARYAAAAPVVLPQVGIAPPALNPATAPRTPVANIQPEYRRSGEAISSYAANSAAATVTGTDASQINPTYARSGEWIGR